jgi:hypothetical protein
MQFIYVFSLQLSIEAALDESLDESCEYEGGGEIIDNESAILSIDPRGKS